MKTMTASELAEKLTKNEEVCILDVRSSEKYNAYHIDNENVRSLNIEKSNIFTFNEEVVSSLPKNQEIIVTCTTGNSARKCADILSEKGFDVTVLSGGVTAWKEIND
ncbi:rhodanese-like domain-containing protein [Bacillus sp. FJAT-29937]|uniref:rhodanese-like domain-containing protein n=1 Tax=Bacillus sp. FJAT-29937 TaxID=1720553 RepID=UPI0008319D61|nr:rhodanese-like domain-containing protein [Bacillus sp. FJAT-29937]